VGSVRTSIHSESPEQPGIPARNGFTAYNALSPVTSSFCHRRLRIKVCPSPVGPTRLRRLDTSNGCQDHAPSPYASASSSCVPEITHGEQSALRSHRTPNAAASTASRPAFVTIAIRPFQWDETARVIEVIWVFGKPEYFCEGGWTGKSARRPSGKSVGLGGEGCAISHDDASR
jgi:hypothetical protein